MLSESIENYPGLGEGTTGTYLVDAMEEQAARLAAEARDLETYRIVHGHLVRLFVESYARWIRGRRRAVVRSMH